MVIQKSECCTANIKLTGKPRPNAFECVKCGRIIGTLVKNTKRDIMSNLLIDRGLDVDIRKLRIEVKKLSNKIKDTPLFIYLRSILGPKHSEPHSKHNTSNPI